MRRRRRRRNNLITSIALICAILMITILPLPVAEAANFTVSKSNVSLETGKSSTITINAPTHTGRINITSSNSVVATVSDSSLWVENDSKTITITAKSSGIATITIRGELYDSSADEENEFVRTVNVTVTKASTSGSISTGGNLGGSSNGNTGSSTSGSTANNNQSSSGSSSSSGTSSSGGQSSTTTSKPSTSKPSSNVTSNSSNSSFASTKPSTSSSSTVNKETQNNTTVIQQEEVLMEEEIINEEENVMQAEPISEEVEMLETEEDIELEQTNGKIEETTLANFNEKTIIMMGIGVMAVIITGIGIFISKKIFKR